MKKILFITTQFPYPLDNGGKIGAFNGLDSLTDHEIYLLAFSEQMELVDQGKKILCSRWNNLRVCNVIQHDIHIQKKILQLGTKILQSYIGKYPYMVAKFINREMYNQIDSLMNSHYFDIIFIDYLNVHSYGEYIRKNYRDKYGLFILKDHNIEYEIFKQTSDKFKGLKKLLTKPIWKKTRAYEIESIKNADIVLSVCDENTNYFKKYNSHSFTMKPTLDILPRKNKIVENHRILYIGNLSWSANLKGLVWFVEKVMPHVKKTFPDVTLTIVGSGSVENPFVEKDYVEWLGYVEDLSDIYDEHRLFIVPLFEGSGIRIKILEAFNNEIPVISTSMACETIGVESGKELIISDTETDFANSIEKLFSDSSLYDEITYNAKSFLNNYFSIDSRKKEMNQLIDKYARNRQDVESLSGEME